MSERAFPFFVSFSLYNHAKKPSPRYGRTAFMDLPIGLVFEIMLFRSPFYRKTLDSVLRLRFSPTDTHFTHFCLRLTVPAGRISLTNRFRTAGEHDAVSRVHILNRCAIRRMELFALHIADIPAFQFRTRRFNRAYCPFQRQRKPSFHPTGRRPFHSCPFYRPSH